MRFRPSRDDEPELNLVPLIDVLLMTLIFLVVTTSFSKESQLRIRLPEATINERVTDTTLTVSIDAHGQYFLNNKQLLKSTPEGLRNAMWRAIRGKKDPIVIIYADAKTPHQSVVYVMDAARRLGVKKLTFATQKPKPDK